MVYDHVFGRWDPLGERFWDEEQQAYVQVSGGSVDVEYATKHLRYENRGTDIWILEYGTWQEYDPDSEYIGDMQEDWQTGALLVYNNDFKRYEPFAEPFQPDGASYTVMNEFDMVSLMYDDGTTVYLENYGDGAFLSTEATGYSLIQMRGEESYYDSTNGFWWSYGWDNWSFSIDGGSTWTEAPSLEIRVVEDPAAESYVGIFDGREWTPVDGWLEFLDENFPQVGWLGMDQFFYDLYDGVGYDGESLRLTVQEIYEFEDDPVMDRWGHWPAAGHEASDTTVPNGKLSKVLVKAYGCLTDTRYGSFTVPNPSVYFKDRLGEEPLTVLFRQLGGLHWESRGVATDVLVCDCWSFSYSMESVVSIAEAICESTGQQIKLLGFLDHGALDQFVVGQTVISSSNFYEEGHDKSFARLNDSMTDGGQIQHYGCQIAGPDPYGVCSDPANLEHENEGSYEYRAFMARRMLSSMAELSMTTVFASSDLQMPDGYDISDDWKLIAIYCTEWCLEFGIGPDNRQVHYERGFDAGMWEPRIWLTPNTQYLDGTVYDVPESLRGYEAFFPTFGEEGGNIYLPLYWHGW